MPRTLIQHTANQARAAKVRRLAAIITAAGLAGFAPAAALGAFSADRRPEPPDASSSTVRPTKLPDSAAARCAQDFLDLINAGTARASREFEARWASKSRLAQASADERAARAPHLHAQWSPAVPTEVLAASEEAITLAVHVQNRRTVQMEFRMNADEPGRLDGVLITDGGPGADSQPLTADRRAALVKGAARALQDEYVYPEVADRIAKQVLAKLEAGEYDDLANEDALSRRLVADFRAVSHDGHLSMAVAPAGGPQREPGMPPIEALRRDNFAFRKAEILPGNLGYLRFDLFVNDAEAKKTAAAALQFLSHCDALVIDLRNNGGGDPEMIRYLSSYFFDEPAHLNDMVDRDGKVVEEYWTLDDVPGERFPADLPVFILTSRHTFSGAEEFAYNFKNLARATVIGETTGGGAHPVKAVRLDDRVVMGVPYMRARNPVTQTNWEGSGVEPHIAVAADQALDRAVDEAAGAIGRRRASARK